MEREETKLLKRFREKCERRDRNEERRRACIEHLKQMIAEIPSDPEDIPDEDKQIEEAIYEAEIEYNMREKAKKIFRVAEKVFDIHGNEVAFIKAVSTMRF